jgi:hypothetical protein
MREGKKPTGEGILPDSIQRAKILYECIQAKCASQSFNLKNPEDSTFSIIVFIEYHLRIIVLVDGSGAEVGDRPSETES